MKGKQLMGGVCTGEGRREMDRKVKGETGRKVRKEEGAEGDRVHKGETTGGETGRSKRGRREEKRVHRGGRTGRGRGGSEKEKDRLKGACAQGRKD